MRIPTFGTTLLLCAACQEATTDPTPTPSSAGLAAVPSAPVDHLAKGELLESENLALVLPLPRGMRVDQAFVDVVYASGPYPPEDVANYFRARVRDGSVTPGASATVFENVRLPASPDMLLTIRVQPGPNGFGSTRVEVRNVTPPPSPNLPNEESRWKAAGLKPNGELLDPKHTQ
jgi:hypothetical protein